MDLVKKSKPTDYFKRIKLKDGKRVVDHTILQQTRQEPKIKELDLA